MSRFTADEIALLKVLVSHHQMSMCTLLKHPNADLTPEGRDQYTRDIAAAERLKDKLTDEYMGAVSIPGVAA